MLPSRSEILIVGVNVLVLVGVLWWLKNKIVGAVQAGAINPANPENVFNQGVTSLVQSASGDPSQTLVGWVDDVFGVNQGLAPGERAGPGGLIYSAPTRTLENGLVVH